MASKTRFLGPTPNQKKQDSQSGCGNLIFIFMTTPKFKEKTEKFYHFNTLFNEWVKNWGQKSILLQNLDQK